MYHDNGWNSSAQSDIYKIETTSKKKKNDDRLMFMLDLSVFDNCVE